MNRGETRGQRLAEQIRRELAELLRLEVKDPRVRMVSLTDVALSPDYAHARIYFTTLRAPDSLREIQLGLDHAAGFLRRELARHIRLHHVPALHFEHDASVERGERLSRLIDVAVKSDRRAED
jgi:ribosome-binding factor A